MGNGLLEELWKKSGFYCMSDLHIEHYRPTVCTLLNEIDHKYPLEEWNNAVAYVFELPGPVAFPSIGAARAFCREQLRQGRAPARKKNRPPGRRRGGRNGAWPTGNF